MPTAGYYASAQTNDLLIGIQREANWGEAPTSGMYQGIRVESFGLQEQANRSRPNEIRADMQVSPSVLQDIAASGGLQFAISYGNADLIWPTLFTSDWTADLAISDTAIAAVNATSQFTGPAGTFSNVAVGQWVKVAGFATPGANGFYRVTAKAGDGASITVATAPADDTNAGSATITVSGSLLANGTVVNSLAIQERYSSSLGFMYAGCVASGGQINAARGSFFSGTVDLTAKSEAKAPSVVGTMAPAPTAPVMNTVTNMQAIALGSLISPKVSRVETRITREGAGADYALGDPAAVGIRPGSFSVGGSVELFFADYAAYDAYKNESHLRTSYRVSDGLGNAYIVDVPKAVLGSVSRQRGGPNQAVMATFDIMADPDPELGWTMAINRFAA